MRQVLVIALVAVLLGLTASVLLAPAPPMRQPPPCRHFSEAEGICP